MMMMMEAPPLGAGGTGERLLRNRGGPQPGSTGGPEIILLTPLISSTNNNKGGQQPNHQDVLAMDVAILDNNDGEEEEEKRSSCGTLIQSWRNDLSRVETIVGHVARHCLDRSSQFDQFLFGAQWIVPMVLLSLLPIHAAILHCQILWVRYAVVVVTTTTTTTNGSHPGDDDDDDDDASNLQQLQSPYLYRNYYRRVFLGCGLAGLATLAVNLPTLLWILVHHDYHDYSEEAFGNDLARAFVVVLANAILLVLVVRGGGGGRLEYVVPTAGLVLIPLLPCLLIIYVLYTLQHHWCHITAMFNHLENEYYSGERFAALEASDQDRLEHQMATLATDPVVVTLQQQRTMMMRTRRRVILNYSDLPRCLSVATLLVIIIHFAMSLLDIDDNINGRRNLVSIRPQGTSRGQGPLQGTTLIGPIFFSVGPFSFIFHIRVRRCMLYQRAKGLVLNRPS
jgi:hypothetical protein